MGTNGRQIIFGIAVTALALVLIFLGLGWFLHRAGDMSKVFRVMPAPDGNQALVFSTTGPTGNMSMMFLSVGLATEKPFPAEFSSPRGKIREILAIEWDFKSPPDDKIVFKWESAERLSICTAAGIKIKRFDAHAETGHTQIDLCPELLDAR